MEKVPDKHLHNRPVTLEQMHFPIYMYIISLNIFYFHKSEKGLGTSYNNIHLLRSLEGDTKICPTQKIHAARGRRIFWVGQIFVSPD